MIELISITISLLGVILLLILYSRIRQVSEELKLKKHRSKSEGLADLLNYAAVVDDGIIVNKNGSFMACWIYRGDDNASSTASQREAVSFRINQAISRLGSGWMLHVDAARRPAQNYSRADASEFPDAISEAIDEERRRYFESRGAVYEGFFIATVTYFPPMLAQAKFVELMFDDDAPTPNGKARTRLLIDDFKREVKGIENRLSATLKLDRLMGDRIVQEDGSTITQDSFLRWLQFCVTGINRPVNLPSNPSYIDCLIGGQELVPGVIPKIGKKFIQVVAIDGFPSESGSSPGMLSMLAEMPVEYRWSTRFIFLDEHESVNHLEKFRKKWKQKVRGFMDQVFNTNNGTIDQDAESMVSDSESAIAEIKTRLVAPGYYTSVIVLMDEDRSKLAAAAESAEKLIQRLGFGARIETINNMDAYMGSLPGHGVENVRRPHMHSMNLADLLPTSTNWTGDSHAPCPMYAASAPPLMHCVTAGSSPFRFNLHVGDLGHTVIFGPTRAGKSTKLALIAAQLRRYAGMRIFAFDKGMSMYPICKATGGTHFKIAGDHDKLAFAPLKFLETRSDRAWAMNWIDTILELNGVKTTPGQRNAIAEAILSMHRTQSKTVTDFHSTIQDEQIREALVPYTVLGDMGYLLDAEDDGLELSNFTTFEIGELMGLPKKFALPVLLYLFRRIERSLDGKPTVIILDEAWLMLGDPAFSAKVREWLKTLAKMNVSVIMATQNLSDAVKSGILDVILESCATKVFLPNKDALEEETKALYTRMGLNPRQIQVIAHATPKKEYYMVSAKGRRLYSLELGPLALSFVAVGDPKSLATIQALEQNFGDAWVTEWLAQRGIDFKKYGKLKNETI